MNKNKNEKLSVAIYRKLRKIEMKSHNEMKQINMNVMFIEFIKIKLTNCNRSTQTH